LESVARLVFLIRPADRRPFRRLARSKSLFLEDEPACDRFFDEISLFLGG